jgi:hypothetical protein
MKIKTDNPSYEIEKLGGLLKNHSQAYTLYRANGICPTIASGQKRYGGLPTWILIEYEEDNN